MCDVIIELAKNTSVTVIFDYSFVRAGSAKKHSRLYGSRFFFLKKPQEKNLRPSALQITTNINSILFITTATITILHIIQ